MIPNSPIRFGMSSQRAVRFGNAAQSKPEGEKARIARQMDDMFTARENPPISAADRAFDEAGDRVQLFSEVQAGKNELLRDDPMLDNILARYGELTENADALGDLPKELKGQVRSAVREASSELDELLGELIKDKLKPRFANEESMEPLPLDKGALTAVAKRIIDNLGAMPLPAKTLDGVLNKIYLASQGLGIEIAYDTLQAQSVKRTLPDEALVVLANYASMNDGNAAEKRIQAPFLKELQKIRDQIAAPQDASRLADVADGKIPAEISGKEVTRADFNQFKTGRALLELQANLTRLNDLVDSLKGKKGLSRNYGIFQDALNVVSGQIGATWTDFTSNRLSSQGAINLLKHTSTRHLIDQKGLKGMTFDLLELAKPISAPETAPAEG